MSAGHNVGRIEALQRRPNQVTELISQDGQTVADGLCGDDARRLAACWNACEGMDTDKLEKLPAPFEKLLSPEFLELVDQLAAARADRANLERRIATQREEMGRLNARVGKLQDQLADSQKWNTELSVGFAKLQANRDAARALLTELLDNSTAFTAAIEINDSHSFDGEAWAKRARAFLAGGGA